MEKGRRKVSVARRVGVGFGSTCTRWASGVGDGEWWATVLRVPARRRGCRRPGLVREQGTSDKEARWRNLIGRAVTDRCRFRLYRKSAADDRFVCFSFVSSLKIWLVFSICRDLTMANDFTSTNVSYYVLKNTFSIRNLFEILDHT
jgi:hypothetical protein